MPFFSSYALNSLFPIADPLGLPPCYLFSFNTRPYVFYSILRLFLGLPPCRYYSLNTLSRAILGVRAFWGVLGVLCVKLRVLCGFFLTWSVSLGMRATFRLQPTFGPPPRLGSWEVHSIFSTYFSINNFIKLRIIFTVQLFLISLLIRKRVHTPELCSGFDSVIFSDFWV
jgi:hypothetical protein